MLADVRRVGVAVSGGADSVCLLHVLVELQPRFGYTLHVVHLNHKLRGQESDADAGFAGAVAAGLSLPITVEEIDIAQRGGNLEQAGREARLALFRKMIQAGVVDRVATGHTRSDQAETVLYRLLRGSGTAGLSGIRPMTSDGIIRPLLDCSRQDVLSFLTDRSVSFREDISNANPEFLRNRIRHEFLPLLIRDYNPQTSEVLAATAELARDEEDWWERHVDQIAAELFIRSGDAVLLSAQRVRCLHPAVGRRVIRKAVFQVKGDLRGIDLHHIDRILELIHAGEGHDRCQAPGLDVFRSFDWVRLAQPETLTRWERDYTIGFVLPTTGSAAELEIPRSHRCIYLEVLENPPAAPESSGYNTGESWLDADKLQPPVELRNWHPGDEIAPVGRSRQKIKLLFQEHRIPIWERQSWPVLTGNGRIVWSREFGADSEFVPEHASRRIVRVREIPCGDSPESKSLV